MKIRTRTLSLILALVMLVSVMPVSAFAEDEAVPTAEQTVEETVEQAEQSAEEEPAEEPAEETPETPTEETPEEPPVESPSVEEPVEEQPVESPTVEEPTAEIQTEAEPEKEITDLSTEPAKTEEPEDTTVVEGGFTVIYADPCIENHDFAADYEAIQEDSALLTANYATQVYSDVSSAGAAVKDYLLNYDRGYLVTKLYGVNSGYSGNIYSYTFNGYIAISYKTTAAPTKNSLNTMFGKIFDEAIKHTGNTHEGDYIYRARMVGITGGWTDAEYDGTYYSWTFVFIPYMTTTVEQERTADAYYQNVINSLNLSSDLTTAQKIRRIYDWICANIDYNYAPYNYYTYDANVHSAYRGIVNGDCVCQGFATVFYRLCLECGIDARSIGLGSGHEWSLVGIDGKYYFLDATWDEDYTSGDRYYFLRGSSWWSKKHDGYYPGNLSCVSSHIKCTSKYNVSSSDYRWPITYVLNGGSNSSSNVSSYDGNSTVMLYNASRKGYCFDGWYTDSNCTDRIYSIPEMNDSPVTVYAHWIPQADRIIITQAGTEVTSKTIEREIRDGQVQLAAEAVSPNAPPQPKQEFTWKTSSKTVATVDGDGLVTFLKPGTVTVTATATDGSKKSASVKFNVKFYDSASKFTVRTDVPTIGLQKGDTARISIYGTDKTTPLDPTLFTYQIATKGGADYIEVHDDGTVTATGVNKTVSVKASLTGDPLKRSVTVNIKTIPVQTGEVTVAPAEGETIHYLGEYDDGFYGVNASGEICTREEATGYALFVNKIVGGAKQYYRLSVTAKDSDGNTIEGLKGSSFTWASSVSKAAPVSVSKDGTVTVTIAVNTTGEGTVSATSKDIAKIKGGIAVHVRDQSPAVNAASVKLDSLKTNETSVTLTPRWGNTINSVELLEYNSKTKSYAEPTLLTLRNYSYDSATGIVTVTIKANSYISNRNIQTQLKVTCGNGRSYGIGLKVTVKNTSPSVTVKQTKFNLFYKDSSSEITATVKTGKNTETIEDMWLVSDCFEGVYSNGKLTVSFSNPSAKPVTRATLYIKLARYDNPVEKAVTITTTTSKPKVTISPASAKISKAAEEKKAVTTVKIGSGTTLSDNAVTTAVNFASASNSGNEVTVELVPVKGSYKGGTVKLAIQDGNWTSPIYCNFSVTLTK